MSKIGKLAIIVPCYNEEEVIEETATALLGVVSKLLKDKKITDNSCICFINDGSKDATWSKIESLKKQSKLVHGIKFSRNFGHQSALLAGLFTCEADAYVTIDADLQDDVEAIAKMVDKFNDGADVVYGVRDSRRSDNFFKRNTAQGFYRVLSLMGVEVVYNHADFRLLSKRAVEALRQFPERNMFLRATVPLLGFESAEVLFDRKKREKGVSKYPLKKMLAFAWDGVTSFSVVPLRLVTILGLIIVLVSLVFSVYAFDRWYTGGVAPGWTSIIAIVCMFSGVQLLSVGVIGEYIGKIYSETKARPRYIIDKEI